MYLVVPEVGDTCVEIDPFFVTAEGLQIIPNYRPGHECDSVAALVGRGRHAPYAVVQQIVSQYVHPELRLPEGM